MTPSVKVYAKLALGYLAIVAPLWFTPDVEHYLITGDWPHFWPWPYQGAFLLTTALIWAGAVSAAAKKISVSSR
jgi:hypothetical protein